MYTKADGSLTSNVAFQAALTGTKITGLTNGTTYTVTVDVANAVLKDASANVSTAFGSAQTNKTVTVAN